MTEPSVTINLHNPVVSSVAQLDSCVVLRLNNDDHGQPYSVLFFRNTTALLAFVTGIVSKAGLTYFEWERPEPIEVCHIEYPEDQYGYADAIDVLL